MRRSRGISSRAWEVIRQQALDRDHWRCQEKTCGKAGALEVHHLQGVFLGGSNEMNNLVTLCQNCHLARHQKPAVTAWRKRLEQIPNR